MHYSGSDGNGKDRPIFSFFSRYDAFYTFSFFSRYDTFYAFSFFSRYDTFYAFFSRYYEQNPGNLNIPVTGTLRSLLAEAG